MGNPHNLLEHGAEKRDGLGLMSTIAWGSKGKHNECVNSTVFER